MIELLKILTCIPFLIYACYKDIQTRRVSNRVWPVMLLTGMIFVVYDLLLTGDLSYAFWYLKWTAISFIIIFTFVYILFYMNAFGGADAKILMVISLLIPIYPSIQLFGQQLPIHGIPPLSLFTFSVFGNAVILTVIVPVGLFLYNLTRPGLKHAIKKPHYMFIGYRCPVEDLDRPHIKLLGTYEEKEDTVEHRFSSSGTTLDEETIERIRRYAKKGLIDNKVWVTPGLPFMVPIAAGFFTAVVYGDLIFQFTWTYLI